MTRGSNDSGGRKRRPSQHDTTRHSTDDGPTSLDGPKVRDLSAGFDSGRVHETTNVDGPPIIMPADVHDTTSNELFFDDESTGEEDTDPTVYRGDKPPRPSSSRRLSPTLMKVFQRKRQQIGLSIAQVARLTGIDEEELRRFEGTNGRHRLVYDHAVLVAKVLGIRPNDLPGLRSGKEPKDPVGAAIGSLSTALATGPTLTFEGKSGERYGGDLERVGTTPHLALKLGDASLGEGWPHGALLGFVVDAQPRAGDVVLLRHRRTKQLVLRRATPQAWAPLATWQPSYPVGGDWSPVARLQVLLARV